MPNYGSIDELRAAQAKGEGMCESCGKPLDMYYVPWCPICEKPKLKPVDTLNIVQALDHISELDGNQKFRERFWNYLMDDSRFGNDVLLTYCFREVKEKEWDDKLTDRWLEDEARFREVFGLVGVDSVVLDVSW